MKLTNNWFTSVTEGEGGTMVIVCGRDEIDAFMASGKFGERVEITWPYVRTANGMPDEAEAKRMEEPQEALQKAMEKDKLSILTGVYTGDGARTWIFYTRNIPAFGERLNQALAPLSNCLLRFIPRKIPIGTSIARCVRFARMRVATSSPTMKGSPYLPLSG